MALCVVPGRVVHKRLTEKQLDLMVCPALRGQRLEEHDDALQVREHQPEENVYQGQGNVT